MGRFLFFSWIPDSAASELACRCRAVACLARVFLSLSLSLSPSASVNTWPGHRLVLWICKPASPASAKKQTGCSVRQAHSGTSQSKGFGGRVPTTPRSGIITIGTCRGGAARPRGTLRSATIGTKEWPPRSPRDALNRGAIHRPARGLLLAPGTFQREASQEWKESPNPERGGGLAGSERSRAGSPSRDPARWRDLQDSAQEADVRRAYRALARRYHPDRGGRREDFQRLQRAPAGAQRMRPSRVERPSDWYVGRSGSGAVGRAVWLRRVPSIDGRGGGQAGWLSLVGRRVRSVDRRSTAAGRRSRRRPSGEF